VNTLDKKLLEEVKNLSPFELKNKLINLANSNEKKELKFSLMLVEEILIGLLLLLEMLFLP